VTRAGDRPSLVSPEIRRVGVLKVRHVRTRVGRGLGIGRLNRCLASDVSVPSGCADISDTSDAYTTLADRTDF